MSQGFRRVVVLVLLLAAGLAAVAIFWPQGFQAARNWVTGAAPQQAQAPAPPPPEVGVVQVKAAQVPLPLEYAGRVAGFREVEIRARVGGTLLKREFREGEAVKEGQVLFRIDPATYEVDRARAQATLAQATANARQAEENYTRIQELARRAVSTEQQLEQAIAQRDLTQAAIKSAEAEIKAAELNIQYTTIEAPVTGVTSLETPPEGSLVLAQSTVLATITQLDPVYVNFSFTDAEYKRFRELNERLAQPIDPQALEVELHYGDGSVYPRPGHIDVTTRRVDALTGTIEARAIFPNPNSNDLGVAILPGQFVRIAVKGVSLPNAIVVPEPAIIQSPQGSAVYVVGEDNKAQARPVQLGARVVDGIVVTNGLNDGDRVVVDGVIRVRPGSPVRPAPTVKPGGQQQAKDGAVPEGGGAAQGGGAPQGGDAPQGGGATATGGGRQ